MTHKALDSAHFVECHERWKKFGHRDVSSSEQPDKWINTQCLTCAYYVPLVGRFSEDYGVCTNAASSQDGRAMFEHDGCDQHVESAEWLQFAITYKSTI